MRKYLQILLVLGFFFAFVIIRHIRKNSEDNIVTESVSPTSDLGLKPTSSINRGKYKNGVFTGSVADAYYGNIQIKVIIVNGRISDIVFLQYPNDNDTSRFINSQAMPMLKTEAIQAQNENVNIISGASDSSRAFGESLSFALQQAK